ncbi:MAG: tRNA dihydrouridine synthase DusB [Thermoanaerobaculia bacterium]|nr:tRNA dihydrouridine synthase DusB [Thermoanaerobaculia bacterium]
MDASTQYSGFRLGPVTVSPPTVLAPMAGVTDRDFRKIVKRIGGVGLVTMEFISSKMLMQGDQRIVKLLDYDEEERPLSIQIYGSEAATMADAAREVQDRGANVCDINMGCPANKVLKGCAGAALMGDLDLARDIVKQVRAVLEIPLTVKFRLGLDDRRANYLELGRICQEEGADAVALHPRTAAQRFTGKADWSAIGELKQAVSIPVLGNGDVRRAEDAVRILRETGCDGVMVGRGATRDPWIFRRIEAALSGSDVMEPTLQDRRDLVLAHFDTLLEREDARHALHKLRTFTNWYSRGWPGGADLRRRIGPAGEDPLALYELVAGYLDELIVAERVEECRAA